MGMDMNVPLKNKPNENGFTLLFEKENYNLFLQLDFRKLLRTKFKNLYPLQYLLKSSYQIEENGSSKYLIFFLLFFLLFLFTFFFTFFFQFPKNISIDIIASVIINELGELESSKQTNKKIREIKFDSNNPPFTLYYVNDSLISLQVLDREEIKYCNSPVQLAHINKYLVEKYKFSKIEKCDFFDYLQILRYDQELNLNFWNTIKFGLKPTLYKIRI